MGMSRRKRQRLRAAGQREAIAATASREGPVLETHADVKLVSGLLNDRRWRIPDRAYGVVPDSMTNIVEAHAKAGTRIAAAGVLERLHRSNVRQERELFAIDVMRTRVAQPPEPADPAATSSQDSAAESVGQFEGEGPLELAFLCRATEEEMRGALRYVAEYVPSLLDPSRTNEEPTE